MEGVILIYDMIRQLYAIINDRLKERRLGTSALTEIAIPESRSSTPERSKRISGSPFHALRHTAVTNVYRASRDLFLAQRFARHVSPLTTGPSWRRSVRLRWSQ